MVVNIKSGLLRRVPRFGKLEIAQEIEYINAIRASSGLISHMVPLQMSSFKKLLFVRSSVGIGLLLIVGSIAYGVVYECGSSNLTERVSDDGYGYVLEKLDEPTKFEKEAGRKALRLWPTITTTDRYQKAYDIVRGKTLIGMNGVEITYALGQPLATKKDKFKRLKYAAADKDHPSCDLYVTFDGESLEPKVVYTSLFVIGNSRD